MVLPISHAGKMWKTLFTCGKNIKPDADYSLFTQEKIVMRVEQP